MSYAFVYKPLKSEEIQVLVLEYFETKSRKTLDKIIRGCYDLVCSAVQSAIFNWDEADINTGLIILTENILKYKVEKGVPFTTFIYGNIKRRIVRIKNGEKNVIKIPINRLEHKDKTIRSKYNTEADAALNISSLDIDLSCNSGSQYDMVPDDRTNIDDKLSSKYRIQAIKDFIWTLPAKDAYILNRTLENASKREIANDLRVSFQNIYLQYDRIVEEAQDFMENYDYIPSTEPVTREELIQQEYEDLYNKV